MIQQLLEIRKVSKLTLLQYGFLLTLLSLLPKFISIPFSIKIGIVLVAIFLLFFPKKNKFTQPFWFMVVFVIAYEILQHYFIAANHLFVLFYLGVLILIARIYFYNASGIIEQNTKMILSLLLFFGGLQKLLSTSFLQGDLMHFMFLQGQLAEPLLQTETFQSYFQENNDALAQYAQNYPSGSKHVFLRPIIPHQYFFFYLFSIFIIAVEFVLAAMVWIRNQKLKFIFFSVFLIGLLLTRIETGFASMLCLMLAIQLPSIEKTYKWCYLILFCICLILMAVGFGLH